MFHLYSFSSAKRAIGRESAFIVQVAKKYSVPASWIRAILLKEMTELNPLDPIADAAVKLYYLQYRLTGRVPRSSLPFLGKKDSSTGWGQIFGFVAIDAINRAADRKLTDYQELGLPVDHRLKKDSPDDLWLVWKRLNRDRYFNIEVCALNLLSCAEEMNGRSDVLSFSPEEIKRTFTRYNANVRSITQYGEKTFEYEREFQRQNV